MSRMHAIKWFDTLIYLVQTDNHYYCSFPSKKRINNVCRKWDQIKILKNKRYRHTDGYKSTERNRQNISSLFCKRIQPNKLKTTILCMQKALGIYVCVYLWWWRDRCVALLLLSLLLTLILTTLHVYVCLHYCLVYCSKTIAITIISASSHNNTKTAYKLHMNQLEFSFSFQFRFVKITLWIPRKFSITSKMQQQQSQRYFSSLVVGKRNTDNTTAFRLKVSHAAHKYASSKRRNTRWKCGICNCLMWSSFV